MGAPSLHVALFAVGACALAAAPGRSTVDSPPRPGESRSIAGPQGRLSIQEEGTGGIPILFVHGNGCNRIQWAAQMAHFGEHRRVAALDLRGMGESAPPANGDYSVEGFAQDVAAAADVLHFRRFVLVGHSFGGAVVAAYAGRHPERLAALVFADSAGDLRGTPREQVEKLREGLAAQTYAKFTDAWFGAILKNSTERTRAAVLRSLHETRREVFTAATLGLYSFDFDDALSRYSGPELSISSFLFDSPLVVHRLHPTIPVRRIPDASHWLMMDRPEQFNRFLEELLDRLT